MSVDTEICNVALGLAKQDATIVSLNEDSTAARRCKRFYRPLLKSLLQSYPWPFARRIISLSQLDIESSEGFSYVYAYPPQALSLLTVRVEGVGGDTVLNKEDYTVLVSSDLKSKHIHANADKAKAEVTVDVVDETLFDALFIEYFAAALSVKLGHVYKLAQSDMNDIKQNYAEIKAMAEGLASGEELRSFDSGNEYVDVRA